MWENWPARKLVEITIDGNLFYLDMRLWECREVNDFTNKFSLDDVTISDDAIHFCFDPKTKNLFQGTSEEFQARREELKLIHLPPLRLLDPIGYRAKMGLSPIKTVTRKRKGKQL